MGEFVFRKVANPLISLDYRPSLRRAKHVATTFKAQADHFQGLREPFSQPKFHPLHGPANGHQCVEGQENGYGRNCNHDLRRALPCTPPDVAGLFSAGYLTVLTSFGIVISAGTNVAELPRHADPPAVSKNKLSTRQG
jgi:hypothetical protein